MKENYILNHTEKIAEIPTKIVHGKNDSICPVEYAVDLHSKLKNSELFIVKGGHSDREPEIAHKLIEILNSL